jgi:hypothetical protein
VRRFYLQRDADVSGVSGTGQVAEGVIFTGGWVAMTWTNEGPRFTSLSVYPDIQTVERIHGHGGRTRVVYLD